MKTDLSSAIRLTNIPQRFLRPENAFERTVMSRYERIHTDIFETSNEASVEVATMIAQTIRNKQAQGRYCILGLIGGHSPRKVYDELIRLHKEEGLSFRNVIAFNVSEYYPLSKEDPHSSISELRKYLFDHVDIDFRNIFTPDSNIKAEEVVEFCRLYEQRIESFGGMDFVLIGVGLLGNIGSNEPGSNINSTTRLMILEGESRKDASKLFGNINSVPAGVITMGVSTILKAKQIVLLAFGEGKSSVIYQAVENKMNDTITASYLQSHPNAKVILDVHAAEHLTRISHPWLVAPCDWDEKLIRRAIVWLCQKLNKPILKLTNTDYNENSLSELLAKFGSAYNVNIKIFNDLQHTITGWPGGKPNADDTHRPERAKPFPKRVVVFSPHPDDDVISMGGTLHRLVAQKHDVHVAYQTSGNIAVGDEEVIRFSMFQEAFMSHFGFVNEESKEKIKKIKQDLAQKIDAIIDTPDVRYIKGLIRRGEAKTACNHMGVKPENVHFLDLPFYETGTIKKGDLSQEDVDIIKNLLREVKPHQIFAAGDLADPHGTHKVCLDAVLAAIDELKEETWMKDCRVWMYRGAWAEWEIDHIEMAVPISPEELRQKRNSILKHQSQMESAPFLGNDERLFWQRSEDRNRTTADLYDRLGLASYEAIEAFVEYKFL